MAAILVPTTFAKRTLEKAKAKKRLKKRLRQENDEEIVREFTPPKYEPVFNFDGFKPLKKLLVKLPWKLCRRPATDEFVENALRKARGLTRAAPEYQSLVPFDREMLAGIPHTVIVACPRCRSATTEDDRRAWRAAKAVSQGAVSDSGIVLKGGGFDPKRRFMAVMVLVMYSLFPTLVASTASMFNCSDPIGGKRYLMADLSVTCYEGALVFVLFYARFLYFDCDHASDSLFFFFFFFFFFSFFFFFFFTDVLRRRAPSLLKLRRCLHRCVLSWHTARIRRDYCVRHLPRIPPDVQGGGIRRGQGRRRGEW